MIVEIDGLQVKFPFEPYPLQLEYMAKVIAAINNRQHAVLESPTGTGKTLCLLTSTLAWLVNEKAEMTNTRQQSDHQQGQPGLQTLDIAQFRDPNKWMHPAKAQNDDERYIVVYTSRTHSQLAQVMKELKATEYRHLKGVALGSRNQLCINENMLIEASTDAEKVHMCRAMVNAKGCGYRTNVESTLDRLADHPILDIEDLVWVGKTHQACPYYMAKQLSRQADVIFLPYNYVLDPKLLKSSNLKLANSIMIFDEAHNVEQVCLDVASVQISSSEIATCIGDITQIMKHLKKNDVKQVFLAGGDDKPAFTINDCAMLQKIVLSFKKEVDGIQLVTSKGRTLTGGQIFEYLSAAAITQESVDDFTKLICRFLEYLQQPEARGIGRKGVGLSKFNEFLGVVYGSMVTDVHAWRDTVEKGYRLHVEIEEPKKRGGGTFSDGWMNTSNQPSRSSDAKVLNFWCFNPAFGMANLVKRNVQSIILTSGTLAPLKPLINELALDVNQQLENPHVIKPTQVLAKIISHGPDGTLLDSGYMNRDNPKYIHSLALTVKTVASVTPNGLLVFFPSYFVMNKAQEAWKASGMWKAINDVKLIFTEPKKKEEFDKCMVDYYNVVNMPRGAIFMAVLRGKVSEGLDFKDQNGRAVIIVGLPFPPCLDARVMLKKQYLEINRNKENQLVTGQEWYNTEATRAVNQAIGRVIRHKDDYGAILLCDRRFHNYKQGLSKWIRGFLDTPSNGKFIFGPVIKELSQFFVNAAKDLPVPVEIKRAPNEHDHRIIKFGGQQIAKVNSGEILNQQTKIEHLNRSCRQSLSLLFANYKVAEKFVKKEETTPSYFGGLNKEVSTSGFNFIDPLQPANSLKSYENTLLEEFESASKKRKLTMIPNQQPSQEVTFDYTDEPVKVEKGVYEGSVPKDRKEFFDMIKSAIPEEHCEYLLDALAKYHEDKSFDLFWKKIMPMFKHHNEKVHIICGLRRFLAASHKSIFDTLMPKHFVVE